MFLSLLFRGRNLICDFDLREYVMQNFEGFHLQNYLWLEGGEFPKAEVKGYTVKM